MPFSRHGSTCNRIWVSIMRFVQLIAFCALCSTNGYLFAQLLPPVKRTPSPRLAMVIAIDEDKQEAVIEIVEERLGWVYSESGIDKDGTKRGPSALQTIFHYEQQVRIPLKAGSFFTKNRERLSDEEIRVRIKPGLAIVCAKRGGMMDEGFFRILSDDVIFAPLDTSQTAKLTEKPKPKWVDDLQKKQP